MVLTTCFKIQLGTKVAICRQGKIVFAAPAASDRDGKKRVEEKSESSFLCGKDRAVCFAFLPRVEPIHVHVVVVSNPFMKREEETS